MSPNTRTLGVFVNAEQRSRYFEVPDKPLTFDNDSKYVYESTQLSLLLCISPKQHDLDHPIAACNSLIPHNGATESFTRIIFLVHLPSPKKENFEICRQSIYCINM